MFGSEGMIMAKRTAGTQWKLSAMEQRASLDGKQVKCLTNDEGHVWMHYFDPLPPAVRRRLAESRFNICPACMHIEAYNVQTKPTVATYFAVIEAIERKLSEGEHQ
jgi:hypothetical protein